MELGFGVGTSRRAKRPKVGNSSSVESQESRRSLRQTAVRRSLALPEIAAIVGSSPLCQSRSRTKSPMPSSTSSLRCRSQSCRNRSFHSSNVSLEIICKGRRFDYRQQLFQALRRFAKCQIAPPEPLGRKLPLVPSSSSSSRVAGKFATMTSL